MTTEENRRPRAKESWLPQLHPRLRGPIISGGGPHDQTPDDAPQGPVQKQRRELPACVKLSIVGSKTEARISTGPARYGVVTRVPSHVAALAQLPVGSGCKRE